jgi:hypothetical protein
VNEAGDGGSLLRQGLLGNLFGFNLRESAQIQTTTKGTASSATTDNAGYAVGATVLTLASAGTGTISMSLQAAMPMFPTAAQSHWQNPDCALQ